MGPSSGSWSAGPLASTNAAISGSKAAVRQPPRGGPEAAEAIPPSRCGAQPHSFTVRPTHLPPPTGKMAKTPSKKGKSGK